MAILLRRRWLIGSLVAVLFVAPAAGERHQRQPIDGKILFLPQAERDRRFAHMEHFYTGRIVPAAGHVRLLPRGEPLPLPATAVADYMTRAHVAGLIVLQDGRIRLERYAAGRGPGDRWTTFSVTKSITSTLVGAAIREGFIKSVDDPVTRYLPDLTGSGYDGVTVAQLLAMRTGVCWNEDYTDPDADVVRLYTDPAPAGEDRTIAYMRRLSSAMPPGAHWSYNTGETDLAGALVRAATQRPLATYLAQTIWRAAGMAHDGWWLTDAGGHAAGGSGLSLTLPDMARFGQFVLDGGTGTVPAGWFAAATHPASVIDDAGDGYGYLWWTYAGGRFAARGIFGQSILIDPASRTVIAIAGDWAHATDPALSAARARFEDAVIAAATR